MAVHQLPARQLNRLAPLGALVAVLMHASPLLARDYGQHGEVFKIVEPDLLRVIEEKLRRMQDSGEMDKFNRELVERTKARVRRPPPVQGITRTVEERSWHHDPSIVTQTDIRDHKGKLIFPKGTRVNPLDKVAMRQSLVFLNGDDPEQVQWALRVTTDLNAMLILTSGDVFKSMKDAQRRFYFDQGGKLTEQFGIRHVPAVVEQDGRVLKVTEVDLASRRRKEG